MVDTFGRWYEEEDYNTYPKEKWCDYDYMAAWIREQGYTPETSMENLITMMFLHYNGELEDDENSEFSFGDDKEYKTYVDGCKAYTEVSGGFKEFDWYC